MCCGATGLVVVTTAVVVGVSEYEERVEVPGASRAAKITNRIDVQ